VSSSDLPPYGEAGGLRPPDTEEGTAAHESGSPEVSPELALVDPALASPEGDHEREVSMSSNGPSNGIFFVEQQPATPPAATPPAVAAPVAPAEPAAPAPEAQPAPTAPIREGMRDVPLGTLIFRAGLLAEEQLEEALQEGMRTGKRLGEVLVARGLISEDDLGRLLAGQQGLRFVELASTPVDPAAVSMLPEENARMQNALPIGFDEGAPVVAVADPTNNLVIENVRRGLGTEPKLVVAGHGDLARKIDEAYATVVVAAAPPEPAPAAAPAPELPVAQPVVEPQPQLPVVQAPSQPESPVAPETPVVQPLSTPEPMPTVLPPAEERQPEPDPLVAVAPPPAAPAEVPPLLAQPAPAVTPEAPQPVVVDPVVAPMPEPEVIAPLEQPLDAVLLTQAVEEIQEPVVQEPLVPPAPEPPVVQEPVEATTETVEDTEAVAPTHYVVLRLTEGDHVEIGAFASETEAENFARTVVGRIARAEDETTWPLFSGRFVRPQTIVSVDVVEHAVSNWTGSAARSRWAQTSDA
jgi:Type II secretion system (T2SS), protein E, N-terminal domain